MPEITGLRVKLSVFEPNFEFVTTWGSTVCVLISPSNPNLYCSILGTADNNERDFVGRRAPEPANYSEKSYSVLVVRSEPLQTKQAKFESDKI